MLIALLSLALSQPATPDQRATPHVAIPAALLSPPALGTKTRNVFLVMSDGLRWQEVFTGADERLIHKDYGVTNDKLARANYWRDTPEERRKALMPFVWSTVAVRPVTSSTSLAFVRMCPSEEITTP